MSDETEDVHVLVDALVEVIKERVKDAKKSGQLIPHKRTYRKWVLKDFKYTDNGVENSHAVSETIHEDYWDSVVPEILDVVEKSQLYKQMLQKMKSAEFDEDNIVGNFAGGDNIIDNFAYKVIRECLVNEPMNDTAIDKIKQILLKEINGESVKTIALMSFVGIVLRPQRIKISDIISIRQTQKEDLEKEIRNSIFDSVSRPPYPSAMMTIEDCTGYSRSLQRKEYLSIAILRLFKVASLECIQSQRSTESLRGSSTMSTRYAPTLVVHIVGIIKEGEEKLLRNFWHDIEDHIPKSFFDPATPDHNYSAIAYRRYCDALLKSGPEEFRITNVMMGLESIFLQGEGELSYRLRLRASKLVSNFGYDPLQATKMIRDAYEIRSKFVHGGLQDFKSKEKLAEKYGSTNNLIEKILDFLRLAIIVSISMRESKEELISTIDESFLTEDGEKKLENLLRQSREILKESYQAKTNP